MPVDSLAEDGVPPEEGDTVQYSVSGTVQSVSGSMATVKIDTVNGEPVGAESSEGSEEEGEEGGENPGNSGNPGNPGNPGSSNPGNPSPMAPPMGGVSGRAPQRPLRGRMDRAGTDLMRAKLLKGAGGRSLPF